MVVVSITDCPATLRGDLTKWLFEINVGVYVGHISARVRDELWNRIVENCKVGRVTMVYQTNNEQRIKFRVHNSTWKPIDFDGLTLMLRPVDDYLNRTSSLRPGFSKAAQHQIVKRIQAAEERKRAKTNDDVLVEPAMPDEVKNIENASSSNSKCEIDEADAVEATKQGGFETTTENETQAIAGESRLEQSKKSEQLCSKGSGTLLGDDERTKRNQRRPIENSVPVRSGSLSETKAIHDGTVKQPLPCEPECIKRKECKLREENVSSYAQVLPDTPLLREREEKLPSKSAENPIEIVQVTKTVRVRKKSPNTAPVETTKSAQAQRALNSHKSACVTKSPLLSTNATGNYVIIDIETTGLDENENEIIEIGAIRVRQCEMTERFQCFVEPSDKLPQFIVNLTGITDDMLESQGIPLEDALAQFVNFIGQDRLVGHNVEFDVKFIQSALKECGMQKINNPTTCTLNLAKARLPCAKKYSLKALMLYLNIESNGEHRSLADCENVYKLYGKMIEFKE